MTGAVTYQILSGGQTGVDRAALDVALDLGLPCGGWCPAGRWAEDGPIPPRYPLRETPSPDPAIRTARNVRECDGLLVLAPGTPYGGTAWAIATAREDAVPTLIADPSSEGAGAGVSAWLRGVLPQGGRVNVAGPRESEAPGVYRAATRVLTAAFRPYGSR